MKTLSVRQPWAHMIIHEPWKKDIENRTRRMHHTGSLLIHASLTETRADWEAAREFCEERQLPEPPPRGSTARGGIVGKVTVKGCVDDSESPWFAGPHGLCLEEQKEVPFFPCKGRLGLFDVDMSQEQEKEGD